MASVRKKILIVEDEPEILKAYVKAFAAAGFEVLQSSQGMDGIVQAVEGHPDLIILDLMLPQVDGFELLQALKNNSELTIPVVVLSNSNDPKSIERALALGAKAFLLKLDYPPPKLVEKIRAFLAHPVIP